MREYVPICLVLVERCVEDLYESILKSGATIHFPYWIYRARFENLKFSISFEAKYGKPFNSY